MEPRIRPSRDPKTLESLYPYPLPKVDPSWLTSTAVAITNAIAEEGAWDRLPVLADELEEAGCQDVAILLHLRGHSHGEGKFPNRNGGCWEGKCWVVQHLRGKPQRVMGYTSGGRSATVGYYQDDPAPVVAPGDYFGTVFAVTPHTWAGGPVYLVEAQNAGYALDAFIESAFGEHFRIDPKVLALYEDHRETDAEGRWTGFYTCGFTDSGIAFDLEDVHIAETNDILYIGPGEPHIGIDADQYGEPAICEQCGGLGQLDGQYFCCGEACALARRIETGDLPDVYDDRMGFPDVLE